MLVLGIETSCDETGIAVYDSERGLLADSVYSQVDIHAQFGGVIPGSRGMREHIPAVSDFLLTASLRRACQLSRLTGKVPDLQSYG